MQKYIALTGEEKFRLEDGRVVEGGPGEYIAEDGTFLDVLGGGVRERGRVHDDELDLFDFEQYGATGHVEWNGSQHVLVIDEPAPEDEYRFS